MLKRTPTSSIVNHLLTSSVFVVDDGVSCSCSSLFASLFGSMALARYAMGAELQLRYRGPKNANLSQGCGAWEVSTSLSPYTCSNTVHPSSPWVQAFQALKGWFPAGPKPFGPAPWALAGSKTFGPAPWARGLFSYVSAVQNSQGPELCTQSAVSSACSLFKSESCDISH